MAAGAAAQAPMMWPLPMGWLHLCTGGAAVWLCQQIDGEDSPWLSGKDAIFLSEFSILNLAAVGRDRPTSQGLQFLLPAP